MRTILPDVFLGRQPILARDHRVVAYELLYRGGREQEQAAVGDDLQATTRVIRNAFQALGIQTVVGESRAFVNLCAESLLGTLIESLPQDKVVLEILETVVIDGPIIDRCRQLKAMGYQLALDDFSAYDEAYEPLLDLVDIVKIDLPLVAPGDLETLVRRLKLRPAKLLAEKVDSVERARECLALGFDFFQGFFYSRPQLVSA